MTKYIISFVIGVAVAVPITYILTKNTAVACLEKDYAEYKQQYKLLHENAKIQAVAHEKNELKNSTEKIGVSEPLRYSERHPWKDDASKEMAPCEIDVSEFEDSTEYEKIEWTYYIPNSVCVDDFNDEIVLEKDVERILGICGSKDEGDRIFIKDKELRAVYCVRWSAETFPGLLYDTEVQYEF